MRRRILALVALAMLVVPVAPVAARSTFVYHFNSTGQGAVAFWGTEPAAPQPGVEYTLAFVQLQLGVQVGTGAPVAHVRDLGFTSVVYKYDAAWTKIFIKRTSGGASGSGVKASFGPNLSSASASATVALQSCDHDFDEDGECLNPEDAGSGVVVASWIGQGPIFRNLSTDHERLVGLHLIFNGPGLIRSAIASASLSGVNLESFGTPMGAAIDKGTLAAVFVVH